MSLAGNDHMVYTVKQLADLAGISPRTLHYYDEIGLLEPSSYGENRYRYYDDEAMLRLQQILFYREMGLNLQKIQEILDQPDFIYVDLLPLWRNYADTAKGFPRIAVQAQERAPGLVKALSNIKPSLREITNYRGWPRSVVAQDPTPENLMEALRDGPYGRCVYHCDNDVVDHQVLSMQFEGGASVTLTMHGHSHTEGRFTRIQGSRAELQATFGYGGSWIEVNEHRSDRRMHYDTSTDKGSGHGGGDEKLMDAFLCSLREGGAMNFQLASHLSTARQSLESHLMAFAAEEARFGERVVRMAEFR